MLRKYWFCVHSLFIIFMLGLIALTCYKCNSRGSIYFYDIYKYQSLGMTLLLLTIPSCPQYMLILKGANVLAFCLIGISMLFFFSKNIIIFDAPQIYQDIAITMMCWFTIPLAIIKVDRQSVNQREFDYIYRHTKCQQTQELTIAKLSPTPAHAGINV